MCPFSCFHVVKCVHRHGNTWRVCLQYRGDVVPQVASTAMVPGRDRGICSVLCARAPCFLLACTVVITRENIMFATSKRLRHERGNPRKMPEVRLMTLKRDLRGGGGEVEGGGLAVRLHCSFSPQVFAVITYMFRTTPHVISD